MLFCNLFVSRNFKLFRAVTLSMWCVIYPTKLESEMLAFMKCLQKVGPDMGFVLKKPKTIPMDDDRTGTYVKKVNEVKQCFFHTACFFIRIYF